MSVTELISFDKNGEAIRGFGWRSLLRKLFLALVILLTATLAFAVGRLTASPAGQGIRIEYDPSLGQSSSAPPISLPASAAQSLPLPTPSSPHAASNGEVVASKSGSKYHYPSCPGAKQIKEANKITFPSREAAEAAGYTLAANCVPR